MAYDPDIHELATRFPGAFLALLGVTATGRYTVESVEVKTSARRIDLVFTPARRTDPRIYLEYQARRDPDVERRALQEVVNHCVQTGNFDRVLVAIVYTRQEYRACALPADIGHAKARVVPFSPLRLVLTEEDPERLLAAGGAALIALPLVGSGERVKLSASDWLARLKKTPPERAQRDAAVDSFLRLLVWRLGRMDVRKILKGQESIMKETATGRALIAETRAEGQRASISTVVEARLGVVPDWLPARLEVVTRLAQLEKILRGVSHVESLSDLEALLPPARRSRRRAK